MTIVVEDTASASIGDYAALQTSVGAWMNRTDLGNIIPDFVAIAEARMQSDLRLREGVVSSTLTTAADVQTVALPGDWLEFVSLSLDGAPLQLMSADRIRDLSGGGSVEPKHYAIEGANLVLSQTPNEAYVIDINYHAKIPALATNSTNWLLTKYPQIYLYASLVSGFQYLMNDQRADYFGNLYAQAVAVAKAADVRALSSGSPLRIRPR